jgi:NAD(P)-dependent dehydrogenase (short-subunit alcohol dehydrogenase family)
MDTNRLENKVAIVTGGASGIGEAVAVKFAENGCNIVLLDINKEGMERVAKVIEEKGVQCRIQEVDTTDEKNVIRAFKETVDEFGKLNLLVNSAGRDSLSPPISSTTLDEWNKTIGPNLTGVFLCCREAFRIMEKQDFGGRIINMGSSSTKVASCPGHSPYRASKHGMLGLSKNILLEGKDKKIGVTVINPSHVKTPMTAIIDKGLYDVDLPAYTDGWLDEKEQKEGIHASCIDVDNVAEITLYVATRTPDVTIPTVSLYPTHKITRYGMEV